MSELDVVAELDIWLNKDPWRGVLDRTTAQRARDEIVALRAERDALQWNAGLSWKAVRAEALEEAAREAAALGCKTCAAAIRALKDS